MKIFNARTGQPVENTAAEIRLNSIVERGHAELSFYGTHPEPLKTDGIQRRFWTPAEIEAEDGSG